MDTEKLSVMLSRDDLFCLCRFLQRASFSYLDSLHDFLEPYFDTAELGDALEYGKDEFVEPMKTCDSLRSYLRDVLVSNGGCCPDDFKDNFTEDNDEC